MDGEGGRRRGPLVSSKELRGEVDVRDGEGDGLVEARGTGEGSLREGGVAVGVDLQNMYRSEGVMKERSERRAGRRSGDGAHWEGFSSVLGEISHSPENDDALGLFAVLCSERHETSPAAVLRVGGSGDEDDGSERCCVDEVLGGSRRLGVGEGDHGDWEDGSEEGWGGSGEALEVCEGKRRRKRRARREEMGEALELRSPGM